MTKHSESLCHKEAVQRLLEIPKSTGDVGEALNSQLAEQRRNSRECLLQIIRSVRFLARQGLALRGTFRDGGEVDSNFSQLLKFMSEQDETLAKWVEKRTDKYTSAPVQNELLKIMALRILRQLASNIRGKYFSIMVDETTDCSTVEQCVLVIRWVDESLEPQEDFVGFYAVDVANADTIVAVIRDTLVRLGLSLSDCRGQCYDGAAVMRGARNGVAKRILQEQPKAMFTHCYGHSLNLACQDLARNVAPVKEALDTTFDFSKLLKYSAKRSAEFSKLKAEIAPEEPGFRTLCPTRWTVRASSLHSVLANYEVLQASAERFSEMAKYDQEMSAKCNSMKFQLCSFNFLFGLCLGHLILQLADNLSKALQQKSLSAAEGLGMAQKTLQSLKFLRSDKEFEKFWEEVMAKQEQFGVNEPQLPRKRRAPARLEDGQAAPHFPQSVEDHYRPIYFQAIDSIVSAIQERFDQEGLKSYLLLEGLLLRAVAGDEFEDEAAHVEQIWGDDLKMAVLRSQLHILRTHFAEASSNSPSLSDIVEYVKSQPARATFMSEVVVLLTLILVTPATNATSERSFSALRRLKTYLRSTMTQERLNHCALVHVMKEECDSLDVLDLAEDFVQGNDHRSQVFGKFR